MLERIPEGVVNFFAGRSIDAHVDLCVPESVESRLLYFIQNGYVLLVYSNHQGHAEGMGFAKVSEYSIKLAKRVGRDDIKGLIAPMAESWATGHQGEELKGSYEFFRGAAENKGLIANRDTREKDERDYKLKRGSNIVREALPFARKVRAGYGIADLPEGGIQGGRHPKGTSIEHIYGMQEVQGDNLIGFFRIIKTAGKKPLLLPAAQHGSYRLVDSPEKIAGESPIEPKLTPEGKRSLILGALGIPFGVLKIRVNLLDPFTEEDIVRDLGSDWMEDVPVFNRYAMSKLVSGLPTQAWGVYADPEDTANGIELSATS